MSAVKLLCLVVAMAASSAGAEGVCQWECYSEETYVHTHYTRYHCARPNCNGQPTCQDLSDAGQNTPLASDTPTLGGLRINSPDKSVDSAHLSVNTVVDGLPEYEQVFSWTPSYSVSEVICKAGTEFFIYDLNDVAAGGATSDVGIVCPYGKGISHLDFCGPESGLLAGGTGGSDGGSDGGADVTPNADPCDAVVCDSPPVAACAALTNGNSGVCASTCDPSTHLCEPQGLVFCTYAYTPRPATTTCRMAPAEDVCDKSETCDGVSPYCPADELFGSEKVCREAPLGCDVPEHCDGVDPKCPEDRYRNEGFLCRASAGVCDVEETCSGASPACPADAFEPDTTVCRLAEEFAGSCDRTEYCTGSGVQCPEDAGYTNGGTFKCGTDIYLTGGVDAGDLFAGKASTLYFANDKNCNIGANKRTNYPAACEMEKDDVAVPCLTSAGCVPAICPNGKELSNAVFGSCIKSEATGQWVWTCTGKSNNGQVGTDLCPARRLGDIIV